MTPTIDFIKDKFREYNKKMFDDKLPMPRIYPVIARRYIGSCFPKRIRNRSGSGDSYYMWSLKFSIIMDFPKKVWEDTIIHEMIHYYIHINDLKDASSHGEIFRQMMNDINERFHRNITISIRNLDHNPLEKFYNSYRVWRVIAYLELINGEKAAKILPNDPKKIQYYYDEYLFWPEVEHICLYKTDDPYFNRFPISSSTAVRIPRDQKKLVSHIKKAEPYEFPHVVSDPHALAKAMGAKLSFRKLRKKS